MNNQSIIQIPVPKTKDPFVNTALLSVKKDPSGVEWFWTTSYNAVSGTMGLLFSEKGDYRIYQFSSDFPGFYSAIRESDDILWLCGTLDKVVRLSLSTGDYDIFETGAPRGLVFSGMIYDSATGKLFAMSFVSGEQIAFSFDTKIRKTVRLYKNFTKQHYLYASFPNGDGTYMASIQTPDWELVCWNPVTETLESSGIYHGALRFLNHPKFGTYVPELGWIRPKTQELFEGGPIPERELTWFHCGEGKALGAEEGESGAIVSIWNFDTGKVSELCRIPDCSCRSILKTDSGKLVAISCFGEFYCLNAETGELDFTRDFPVLQANRVDCVCRIDETRLLGTPFITERFWEANLTTGEGHDCGRVAPGFGQVEFIMKVSGKIYLAAYCEGLLMEYDPSKEPDFPQNPRVVVNPPDGMRPTACTHDDRFIYYACSRPYGHLGSVLIRYDIKTGECLQNTESFLLHRINSLFLDKDKKALYAGSSNQADCGSIPAESDKCLLFTIDIETLKPLKQITAPVKTTSCQIIGPLSSHHWLCLSEPDRKWLNYDDTKYQYSEISEYPEILNDFKQVSPGSETGEFIIWHGDMVERWNLAKSQKIQTFSANFKGYAIYISDDTVYLAEKDCLTLLNHCLQK